MTILRGAALCSLFALANGQNVETCTATGNINAYPSVRRSGDSSNGYAAAPHFVASLAGFFGALMSGNPMIPYQSDINLEWIHFTRTTDPDKQYNCYFGCPGAQGTFPTSQWGTGANCNFEPLCGLYGVSNATTSQNQKKEFIELMDVISLDVVVEMNPNAEPLGFVNGILREGSKIFVKIACTDGTCDTWSGPSGANMINVLDWVTNAGTAAVGGPWAGGSGYDAHPGYAGQLTVTNCGGAGGSTCPLPTPNPDATIATKTEYDSGNIAGTNGAHVELTVGTGGVAIDEALGNVLGTIIAEVILPPETLGQLQIRTYTSELAYEIFDSRCIGGLTGGNQVTIEGTTNVKYITFPPPMPNPPPPPPNISPPPTGCTSDDDDSDGDSKDSADSNDDGGGDDDDGDDGDSANSGSGSSASSASSDSGSGSASSASSDSGSGSSGSGSSASAESGSGRRLDSGSGSSGSGSSASSASSASDSGSGSDGGSNDDGDDDGSDGNGSNGGSNSGAGGGSDSDSDDCDDDSDGDSKDSADSNDDGGGDDDADDDGGASANSGSGSSASSASDSGSGSSASSDSGSGSSGSGSSDGDSKDAGGADDDTGSGN